LDCGSLLPLCGGRSLLRAGRRLKIGARTFAKFCQTLRMSQVAELLKEASKLDLRDRAELISSLL
jgi:hypothetical protein